MRRGLRGEKEARRKRGVGKEKNVAQIDEERNIKSVE